MTSRIKVYELAKELALDSQHLVDVIQRLGIDIKNSMSVLGSEEVRTVREYYRKQKPMAKSAAAAQTAGKSQVSEKRVGATVIRRRSAASAAPTSATSSSASSEEATEEPVRAPVEARPANREKKTSRVTEIVHEEASEATVAALSEEQFEADTQEEPQAEPEAEVEEAEEAEVESASAQAEPEISAETLKEQEASAEASTKTAVGAKAEVGQPVVAPAPPKPRRIFPSIIKKVATEEYLGEKVGPKVERKERPKTVAPAPAVRKPGAPGTAAKPAGTTTPGAVGTGLKRVREVEVVPTEAAKEAPGKRRAPTRENTVFKSADYLKRELVHATRKKKGVANRPALKTQLTTAAQHKRVVEMGDAISVSDLARDMGIKASMLIGKLMGMGVTATMNQSVDHDTATLVAQEFGYEVKQKVFKEEDFVPAVDMSPEGMKTRPPVVTIMGHVDHGKTSLLDAIRKTQVAAREAGGITQHIGAYTVQLPKGKITFVDTPGHEAFTAMRARGAKVTDIVIVVVSAVDGVMPQTLESVNHAQAAKVPIIVAVNKIDLPDSNPDRIKQNLAGHNLSPEEWGGETIYVPVSAKTGQGIDQLLESILLQSEMLELKANYETAARGTVVESRLDKNRGPVATVLIQHGRLKSGDIAVCGVTYGKVRAMTDSNGKRMNEALPGDPVEILGLPAVPTVGDELFVAPDEKTARELTTARGDRMKALAVESKPKMSLEDMIGAADGGDQKELRVILRADVQGSTEALREALSKLPMDKVKLKILHAGTGGITESDVMLASASRAAILGFNIRPDVKSQKLAESEGVELRTYNIIYDLLEDVKRLLEGLLDKVVKEKVIGRAEVRDIFHIPKIGTIAGSAVIDGKVIRGCFLRLLRDSRVIYEGKISSLRRFKEDVKEVSSGFECGIGLENFNDLKLGDQFEAFLKEESRGTL